MRSTCLFASRSRGLLVLAASSLEYWNTSSDGRVVEDGSVRLRVGGDVRLDKTIRVLGGRVKR